MKRKRISKTVFVSYWSLDRFGVTKFLHELDSKKWQRIGSWVVIPSPHSSGGFSIFAEVFVWEKKKK